MTEMRPLAEDSRELLEDLGGRVGPPVKDILLDILSADRGVPFKHH